MLEKKGSEGREQSVQRTVPTWDIVPAYSSTGPHFRIPQCERRLLNSGSTITVGPCIRLAPPGPAAGGGKLRLLCHSSNHLLSSLAIGRAPPTRCRAVKTLPGGQEADSGAFGGPAIF